tara:strand:- start:399 stop:1412 length:1014 start_codon:yes stop_codon:yes gene_type:complete
MIPKSIKYHVNLTEYEIRCYYSLKPLDEDFEVHEKRFNKILNDYVDTRSYPSSNAKLCFKKQLKKMIKDNKKTTPKFQAFNMWRQSRIQFHINRQKDWLLEQSGKAPMPKNERQLKEQLGQTTNDDLKINNLVDEIKELKKQLEEKDKIIQDKDIQIDSLLEEISKAKYLTSEPVYKPKPEVKQVYEMDYLIESSEEEEEEEEVVVEEKPIVVYFDTAEEESEEEDEVEVVEEEEEQKIPYSSGQFYKVKNIFLDTCKKKAEPYHEKYMIEGKDMNDKERRKLSLSIRIDFSNEIVQEEIDKLDNHFEVPDDIYTEIYELAEEKLQDKILYQGFEEV